MSATQRLPDGALIAQRDAPVGGQAVLEGVMMRGVSTWAVGVRKPLPEEVSEDGVDPERGAHGEIEVTSFPLTSVLKKHRLLRLPIVRGVVALVESLVIGFKALGISANAQLPEDEKEISGGMWFGTVRRRAGARHRPLLRRPRRADEPHQGPAQLVVPLLARRGDRAHRDLPRLPAAALAPARPAPRLRVPRRRAQDDLLLRGGPRAHARERPALQPPASALRHELPARRDDRGHLRLRADRPARLVLARAHAHRRRPAHRRHLLRDHQVRRAQPPPALGARGHVARACSCRSSPPASPTSTSSPSPSPPWRRCWRSRTRATSPTRTRIGMEVVA